MVLWSSVFVPVSGGPMVPWSGVQGIVLLCLVALWSCGSAVLWFSFGVIGNKSNTEVK